jgi:TRAP-type mannitol/chloroaromatic compound transport system permease large subunit
MLEAFVPYLAANMAPIMFASLVIVLLLGYPAAFSLAAVGLMYALVGIYVTHQFAPDFLQALPDRIFGIMNNDVLLAIPFFTFMGLILERSGMAEDLLDTIGQLFGSVRGGLAYAVVFVGALLAATTGVVAASVISMGLISLPIMLRYGYDRRLTAGVIAASGTLAQIIPPSLVLIVMADQLGKSVGDMYEGAFLPGLMLAGLYALYVFGVTLVAPDAAPGLPPEAQTIKEDGERHMGRTLVNIVGLALVLPGLAGGIAAALFGLVCLIANLVLGSLGATEISDEVISYGAWALGAIAALAQLMRGFLGSVEIRPHANLAALVGVSAIVGIFALWNSGYHGADLVVLIMFVGIVFAFLIVVGDRWRGFAGVAGALAAMAVAILAYDRAGILMASDVASALQFPLRVLVALAVSGLTWIVVGLVLGGVPPLRAPLLARLTQDVTFVMVPPLFLIFLVLGTIFIGLATPTEGGAMGASGAIILALIKRRLSWDLTRQAAETTAKLSAFVVFILVGARVFSLTFYGVDGHRWVEGLLTSLPGGQLGFLAFVNVFVFVLAFFLDFFEIAFIVIPLLGPAADHLGIDLIWFGVMLGVNIQTSFMHPPFGFALFYLRSVAPREPYVDRVSGKRMEGVTTGQIYWGAVPFVVIQALAVALVISFPALVMHYKTSGPQKSPSQFEIDIPDLPPPPPPDLDIR